MDDAVDVHVTIASYKPCEYRDLAIINEHTRAPASPGKFMPSRRVLSWYAKLAM